MPRPGRARATPGRDRPYHRTHERTADPSLRFLALSHQRRPGRRLRTRPLGAGPRRRRRLPAGVAARGGRSRRAAAPDAGRRGHGHGARSQRAHPRARVRRRRVHRPRWLPRLLGVRRQPADAQAHARCDARGPRRGARPALRGHGARPASRPGHRGPRGPARIGHRGAQPALRRVPGRRRHHRAGQRARLLLGPAPEPGRPSPGLADLGLPADALGRHRPVGGAGPATTARLGAAVHVAGGTEESIAQPRWAPDGSLVFVSDRTDWYNLYRWRSGSTEVEALAPMEAEFAGPQWVFGLSDYGIDADGTVVAASFAMGDMRLWALAPGAAPRDLGVSADEIDYLRVRDGVVTLIGGFATRPTGARDPRPAQWPGGAAARVEQPHRRPRLPLRAAPHRLPDLRRPHGLRLVLPAHQPRRRGARGRGAAARGHVARRADEPGARGAEP